MNVLLQVYSGLCALTGHTFSLNVDDPSGCNEYAMRLGEFDSWAAVQHAGTMLRHWSWHDDTQYRSYRDLAPHGLVVVAGGRLNLVHPTEADVRQAQLLHKTFGEAV